jgi:ornithine cyclodeaminase/alanine dehydrogenase-like protein (mu-crystallin family)
MAPAGRSRRRQPILEESHVTTTTVTLTADDVRAAVSRSEAMDASRPAFFDRDAGAFEQPARVSRSATVDF